MAAEHDPTTGLLVSMHGAGLYNDRYGTFRLAERQFSPSEQALVGRVPGRASALSAVPGRACPGPPDHTHVTTDPQVWYNYLLLQVWDRLSLQYAFRLAADGDLAPLPRPDGTSAVLHCRHHGDLSLRLAPYPFAQSPCTFPLQARLLPDRPYRTAEAFLAAMARAEVTVLECRASRD
jgi:hypothetical protein